MPDIAAAKVEYACSVRLRNEGWTKSVAAGRAPDVPVPMAVVLPALNGIVDLTTTRAMADETRSPLAVSAVLLIRVLASSFLVGHVVAVSEGRDRRRRL